MYKNSITNKNQTSSYKIKHFLRNNFTSIKVKTHSPNKEDTNQEEGLFPN